MEARKFDRTGRWILLLAVCCLTPVRVSAATATNSDATDEAAANSPTTANHAGPAESRIQTQAYTSNKSQGENNAAGEPSPAQDALTPVADGCCDVDLCGAAPDCNMCPCVYGWAESLLLWRNNRSTAQPLVQDLNANDQTLLGTNDLQFGTGAGIRVGVGVHDRCGLGWELNYFGVYGADAGATVEGSNNLRIPGDLGLIVNNFFGADVVDVHYASDLNNVEINRVCCCCDCECPTRCRSIEWLYGVRYLNLHETFSLTAVDFQESSSTYRVRTNNNLFGGQIGTRVRRCCGQWSWEGTGKVGLFGNAAEQAANSITDFPNNFEIRPAQSASHGNVAFIGDLNLTGIYQINCTWGVRAGYNLIWIEGVALAPDQLDFTNTPDSGTALFADAGVFLHGVNVGLEARW